MPIYFSAWLETQKVLCHLTLSFKVLLKATIIYKFKLWSHVLPIWNKSECDAPKLLPRGF